MSNKNRLKDNCFITVIIILMISFTMNIYQSLKTEKYSVELRKQTYSKIEEIKFRNESVLTILDGCITAGSVNNEELLTLYKNYSKISEAEIGLWNDYLSEDNSIFLNKRKKVNKIVAYDTYQNDLYWQIEELVYSYIQNDMREKTEIMELKGKALTDFEVLRDMSYDLNQYFIDFYVEKLNIDATEEKRIEMIIEENYWVDMLRGIQDINNKYVEYSFSY